MRTVLDSSFYNRQCLDVARDLLGKELVTPAGSGIITEVEAYDGPEDKACHAHKGKTERTAPMFGPPGHWYVYLIYGMYWMLNIVTCEEGYPAAVLIRGVGEWDGPGKLTKQFGIDSSFNKQVANQTSGLWIEDRGVVIDRSHIQQTPRIGVEYAGEWAKKPYRFIVDPSVVA